MLAYLAFAKGAYLVLVFPWIQKGGRNLFNRLEARRTAKRAKANGSAGERTPLIRRKTGDRAVDEANQFDVSRPAHIAPPPRNSERAASRPRRVPS